jgi:hypothetical protein
MAEQEIKEQMLETGTHWCYDCGDVFEVSTMILEK